MKRKWTELELTIVYYIVKHGVHGAIRNRETGGFLNEREICDFLNHGQGSYLATVSKFKNALGIPVANLKYFKPTKVQKDIIKKYSNTTVSQLRLAIKSALDELSFKSDGNVLENDKSSRESLKMTSNDNCDINLDDAN